MKIVIATAVYYPQVNGVAVFSHNLALGLTKRGHDVMVICPSQNGKNHIEIIDGVKTAYLKSIQAKVYHDQIHPLPERKKIFGIKMPNLFYKHGFRVSVFPYPEIKDILNDFNPDVVHVQISDPIGLSVVYYARKHNIPVVTTEHNQPEVLTGPMKLPRIIKKPVDAMLSSYFRNRQSKSDFVTMPTSQAIDHLLSGHRIDVPVAAVSNGVDLSNFKPGKAKESIYKEYKISSDKKILLYVGRVDPEKKVEAIIKAYMKARNKLPKTEMIIVGDGVDRIRLEQLVKRNGLDNDVKFLGRVMPPDLYELYKIGDVFVTASEIVTQGIVLIEAAATGLPLIAVDRGAVSEVCRDGENGYLCEPGNIDEMSSAMVKILSDDKMIKRFSEQSLKIANEHNFEKTLDSFINIYNHVIQNKK